MNAGQNVFNENETIAKYEIMDGAPVRGKYEAYELHLQFGIAHDHWCIALFSKICQVNQFVFFS